MHIIIDRALTMYSLHDTCKLIITASLHRKDNQGAQEQHLHQHMVFHSLSTYTMPMRRYRGWCTDSGDS